MLAPYFNALFRSKDTCAATMQQGLIILLYKKGPAALLDNYQYRSRPRCRGGATLVLLRGEAAARATQATAPHARWGYLRTPACGFGGGEGLTAGLVADTRLLHREQLQAASKLQNRRQIVEKVSSSPSDRPDCSWSFSPLVAYAWCTLARSMGS